MSLAEAVGVGPTVVINNETLSVSPRILRHYGEIQAEILSLRGNPFDLIREAKEALKESPEIIDKFVERAFDEAKKWKAVSLLDVQEYLLTDWRGQCFAIWLAIRHNDPQKWTFDYFFNVFCDEYEEKARLDGPEAAGKWIDSIGDKIAQGGGEDELGNSTGSPESTQTETTKE